MSVTKKKAARAAGRPPLAFDQGDVMIQSSLCPDGFPPREPSLAKASPSDGETVDASPVAAASLQPRMSLGVGKPEREGVRTGDPAPIPPKAGLASPAEAEGLAEPVRKDADERQLLLLVDRVRLSRECLGRQLHDCCPDLDLLAVSSSTAGAEAVGGDLPDLAVLNAHGDAFSTPFMEEQIEQLRARSVPLIAIVESLGQAQTEDAARRGISGIFPGDGSIELLVAAIRLVLAGGRFLPAGREDVSIIEGFIAPTAKEEMPADIDVEREVADEEASEFADEQKKDEAFTCREREILKQLLRGSPNKSIARDLGISESTVKAHLRHIMQKLGAANRTEVVSLLIEGKLKEIGAD